MVEGFAEEPAKSGRSLAGEWTKGRVSLHSSAFRPVLQTGYDSDLIYYIYIYSCDATVGLGQLFCTLKACTYEYFWVPKLSCVTVIDVSSFFTQH